MKISFYNGGDSMTIYKVIHVVVDPKDVDTNIKQTLIQLVYTCIKNRISPLSHPSKLK